MLGLWSSQVRERRGAACGQLGPSRILPVRESKLAWVCSVCKLVGPSCPHAPALHEDNTQHTTHYTLHYPYIYTAVIIKIGECFSDPLAIFIIIKPYNIQYIENIMIPVCVDRDSR